MREIESEAAREAARARAAAMIRDTMVSPTRAIVVQPLLERRSHGSVDDRLDFGIVKPVFGLPLELWFGDENRDDRNQPFADIFMRDFDSRGVRLCVSK